jgi:ferredoxin
MIRQVIKIDEDKCTGCGICADACQEGAIGIVDGKAKLLRDDYCDGLGNCLPVRLMRFLLKPVKPPHLMKMR